MNVIIIQSPLVQLNTPYPSGAYLSAFFKNNGHNAKWFDLSNGLFYSIFCREGLTKLFALTSQKALTMANKAESKGDDQTAFNLRRYVSSSQSWINWIDRIVQILCCNQSTQEIKHQFVFGAFTPRGNRTENFLAGLEHDLTTDDAFELASLSLADIADYITAVFDREFSLIRYAENLTVNENSFAAITKSVDSPVNREFYLPLLKALFDENEFLKNADDENPVLVCISVPFAGTFSTALAAGKYFKDTFKNKVFISMGGGFINTELRDIEEPALYGYTDILSYDRGYGSYHALIESDFIRTKDISRIPEDGLYKTRLFIPILKDGKAFYGYSSSDFRKNNDFPGEKCGKENKAPSVTIKIIPPKEKDDSVEHFENLQTVNTIPDYSDINFNLYPRMTDDTNPMHRLWNDGAWIKAYLAHGCYWHRCAFCDTTLDYVKSYRMTNIRNLYRGLLTQAEAHKVYGIHFVDEASPPSALIQFAKENALNQNKLTYWGNIRFEKTFTRDITDFLAKNGLIGVSGGIEIATGSGLNSINKGTDLDSIVASCCAFKESGVLVHAYMIYGYWTDTDQDIIDSMETLRQFFEAGLLDSSFWHKFVLTKHSTVYKQWEENQAAQNKDPHLSKLKPIPAKETYFTRNGLYFEGEKKSEKFGYGLNAALNDWMHGQNLHKSVQKYFDFKVPPPSIPKDFIQKAINRYEQKRDSQYHKKLTPDQTEYALNLIQMNTYPNTVTFNDTPGGLGNKLTNGSFGKDCSDSVQNQLPNGSLNKLTTGSLGTNRSDSEHYCLTNGSLNRLTNGSSPQNPYLKEMSFRLSKLTTGSLDANCTDSVQNPLPNGSLNALPNGSFTTNCSDSEHYCLTNGSLNQQPADSMSHNTTHFKENALPIGSSGGYYSESEQNSLPNGSSAANCPDSIQNKLPLGSFKPDYSDSAQNPLPNGSLNPLPIGSSSQKCPDSMQNQLPLDSFTPNRSDSAQNQLTNGSLSAKENIFWLGGQILTLPDGSLSWNYMGEEFRVKKNASVTTFRGKGLCILH